MGRSHRDFPPIRSARAGGEKRLNAVCSVLERRIQEQCQHLRHIATVYISWFTFFWTLNLGALAWLYARVAAGALPCPIRRDIIAWVFAGMNSLATVTSLVALHALLSMSRESENLFAQWRERVERSSELDDRRPIWPFGFTVYGLMVNALTTIGLIGVWIFAALKVGP